MKVGERHEAGRREAASCVGIIAGSGRLPFLVAESIEASGRDVFVLSLASEAGADLGKFPGITVKWGEIGRLLQALAEHDIRDVVITGGIGKRPDYRDIKLDAGAIRLFPRLVSVTFGSDDDILGKITSLFEEKGYRIVGAHEAAPDLVASVGALGGLKPGSAERRDMALARRAVAAIGRLNIGQAAIAANGRVVGLEAAEGTDALITRIEQLRDAGRISGKPPSGVLVKAPKPGQDLRVDMPTIGPETVERAVRAGLAGIAIAAGSVLVLDRAKVVEQADAGRLFVWAFDADGGEDER